MASFRHFTHSLQFNFDNQVIHFFSQLRKLRLSKIKFIQKSKIISKGGGSEPTSLCLQSFRIWCKEQRPCGQKLCEKVDNAKSRRLCFWQEEGSTRLQEQIAQTGLVSNGWELGLGGGAEQVIKGKQVGPSAFHFLRGSGVPICLLLSHPVVLDICLTRKQARKVMLLKLYVSGDPCTEVFVLKLGTSEGIHYIFHI